MKKTVARIHIGIFLTWVIWCFYRGVLCSLTLLPDVLAPESFSTDYVLFSFVLLAIPLLAPFVTSTLLHAPAWFAEMANIIAKAENVFNIKAVNCLIFVSNYYMVLI